MLNGKGRLKVLASSIIQQTRKKVIMTIIIEEKYHKHNQGHENKPNAMTIHTYTASRLKTVVSNPDINNDNF